jgi:hypothetical protein
LLLSIPVNKAKTLKLGNVTERDEESILFLTFLININLFCSHNKNIFIQNRGLAIF